MPRIGFPRSRRSRAPRSLTPPGAHWRRMIAIIVLVALIPACQITPSQIYIPLAYGVTGLCIALLVSPSLTSACIGLSIGILIGAAVYNNSLKRNLLQRDQP